jgi:hypothetical protein
LIEPVHEQFYQVQTTNTIFTSLQNTYPIVLIAKKQQMKKDGSSN